MKRGFLYSIAALLLAGPGHAQSLAGSWQGVETEPNEPRYWPAVLRLQGKDDQLFGILYEEVGGQPGTTSTFQVKAVRTGNKVQITHGRELNETGGSLTSYWCAGTIAFSYDAALEKLTGHATYQPVGSCTTGEYVFYRVRLKSAATVPAGAPSTVRVSGRNVRWFADAALKQPLATGNTYRTTLRKTTTFYLTQGFYPTVESPVVPITVKVVGSPAPGALPKPAAPLASAPVPSPAPAPADSLAPPTAPAPPTAAPPAPVALPTVLFRQGTPDLLPTAAPALAKLAASLQANPQLRLRVAGHTDRLGEPGKNQALSEQRAAAVKAYLVQAGVAAERLETVGYGDTRPLYPSPDVRNRRVEVEQLP